MYYAYYLDPEASLNHLQLAILYTASILISLARIILMRQLCAPVYASARRRTRFASPVLHIASIEALIALLPTLTEVGISHSLGNLRTKWLLDDLGMAHTSLFSTPVTHSLQASSPSLLSLELFVSV